MPLLRRAVDAASRPLNLVPPAVGAAAAGGLVVVGLAPLALAVGALSLTAWGALVAWELATPPPTPPAPEPPRIQSLLLEQLLGKVTAAAAQVRAAIDAHDGILSASLAELAADCDGLVDAALAAARRGDAVHRFIRDHDPAAVQEEARRHREAARAARDPAASASLAAAADAKDRQLATWRELRSLYDRIAAELVAVDAALDELHARVVQLSLHDPGDVAVTPDVGRNLAEVRSRLQRLESAAAATLKEVA